MIDWFFLSLAGVAEIVWVLGLKYSNGLSKLWPTVITVIFMTASTYFLALAVRSIPIGVSYAVWSAIGIMGSFIVGVVFLGEKATLLNMVFLTLIIIGIIGLKVTTPQ